jgi:hypothetical protein
MTFVSNALLGLLLALPAQQATATDPQTELDALQGEFRKALQVYYQPYDDAKTDEERDAIRLDAAQDPARTFVPRFQELARRAKGSEVGARALLWLATNGREEGSVSAIAAVDELVASYLASPVLSELCQDLSYGSQAIGRDRSLAALARVAQDSPAGDTRAAALFAAGSLRLDAPGEAADAIALFRRVQKEYPDTRWSARAGGALYEAEHLQIGMTAPDFEAVDEEGRTFHLAEYRGKVVVLDFWGFW